MHDPGISSTHNFHSCPPLKGFKAYQLERGVTAAVSFARRDLYQICLVTATSRVCFQGEETVIDRNVLVFAPLNAVGSWESITQAKRGYCCLFTEEFLSRHTRLKSFLLPPLFGLGDLAVYSLNGAQTKSLALIFGQMLFAQDSDYVFKHELMANCLYLLLHEVCKMQPS